MFVATIKNFKVKAMTFTFESDFIEFGMSKNVPLDTNILKT